LSKPCAYGRSIDRSSGGFGYLAVAFGAGIALTVTLTLQSKLIESGVDSGVMKRHTHRLYSVVKAVQDYGLLLYTRSDLSS
jgi:hypothetical protein